uniref:Deoxyhypusine synthase n=1 Tax=Steinernema glaseri TaxID=37863 RepID=A0A1I7Z6B4_9BILA
MSPDLEKAREAVFVKSCGIPTGMSEIRGFDFNDGVDFAKLMDSYLTTGCQATNLACAIEEINKMIEARKEEPEFEDGIDATFPFPEGRKKRGCTIFLGYTSNLVSSGLREVIRFLVEHDMVDCVVTSAGGVEEDLIKCLAPSYLGAFNLPGAQLRQKGLNRAGNVLIPNDNYCKFEDWLMPILDECAAETRFWTPAKLIDRLGERIAHRDSICYWAHRNRIPIFCPALTDGSLGDMLYFHSIRSAPGISLDIVETSCLSGLIVCLYVSAGVVEALLRSTVTFSVFSLFFLVFASCLESPALQDVRHINTMAVKSVKSGVLILGGGVVKHHINNANLMRNGSDYTVFVNTGQEFDGSDSGARPDEAVSWGKVKTTSKAVKVFCDATLVFPLIVARTFARGFKKKSEK